MSTISHGKLSTPLVEGAFRLLPDKQSTNSRYYFNVYQVHTVCGINVPSIKLNQSIILPVVAETKKASLSRSIPSFLSSMANSPCHLCDMTYKRTLNNSPTVESTLVRWLTLRYPRNRHAYWEGFQCALGMFTHKRTNTKCGEAPCPHLLLTQAVKRVRQDHCLPSNLAR